MSQLDRLMRQQQALQARLDKVLARPTEPEADEDGANVIWFQVRYPTGPVLYTYAGVQARGKWFLSGANSSQGRSWDELLDWLDSKNAEVVSMWHAASWEQI